ncbi:PaaI family thioesterase [Bhargavaea ullalensis]|uniref:Medium/long-chain acyl-CoA thioesterase YigI n=1 Tax=Bhargavaea ullalensis TaxID=1265685 RepID=A0ABV2G9U4_9BACL
MVASELDRVRADFEDSEYFRFLGLEITKLEEGDVELRLPYKPELDNVRSTVHGGVFMSVLDTVMGLHIRSIGYDDTMTIQMQTQFLRPLVGGAMTARAEVINRTKSTVLLEGRLYNEADELIGYSTGTFKVMKFD